MTWAGYLLGRSVPNIAEHIHLVVAVVVLLSILPIVNEFLKARRHRKTEAPSAR